MITSHPRQISGVWRGGSRVAADGSSTGTEERRFHLQRTTWIGHSTSDRAEPPPKTTRTGSSATRQGALRSRSMARTIWQKYGLFLGLCLLVFFKLWVVHTEETYGSS